MRYLTQTFYACIVFIVSEMKMLIRSPKYSIKVLRGSLKTKGAVIKYGTEGGGRNLTGSTKLLDGKCWASKIFQVISMGHEGICLQYFAIVLKIFSIILLLSWSLALFSTQF